MVLDIVVRASTMLREMRWIVEVAVLVPQRVAVKISKPSLEEKACT